MANQLQNLTDAFSRALFYVDDDGEHVFRWSETQRLTTEDDPLLSTLPERMAKVAELVLRWEQQP